MPYDCGMTGWRDGTSGVHASNLHATVAACTLSSTGVQSLVVVTPAVLSERNFRGRGNENGSSSETTGDMAMNYTPNERYLDAFSHSVYFMQINSKTRSPWVKRSRILGSV